MSDTVYYLPIPMQWVGPVLIDGDIIRSEHVELPLATFETPMWPSVNRGARAISQSGGVTVSLFDEKMTRSIVMRAPTAAEAIACSQSLQQRLPEMQQVAAQHSRFVQLIEATYHHFGNLLYIRLCYKTGDASGHNMATLASQNIQNWVLQQYTQLQYASISSNLCTDKKVSAVNGLLGRGKSLIAEAVIPQKILARYLRTDAQKMQQLHIHKNLNGSILAGSLHSANAHFANMLLGFYLATGQDGANIIEGSQGYTHVEQRAEALYFSVTLPNVIVGSVGNGKHLPDVQKNLQRLGCMVERSVGDNARRLSAIAAATVICGELSLMAAQTNPGELVASHLQIERGKNALLD